ncbi:MAG: M1 family metallopeptidase [Bacteroidales bacterium]
MYKFGALVTGLFFLFITTGAQVVTARPLSQRLTGYSIRAELDPVSKKINASMESYWINNSENPVPFIRMHMYLNAFRSNKSTLNKEFGQSQGSSEMDYGWINLKTATSGNGIDLSGRIKYISPDDGNPDDMTVLEIALPEPVMPGDTFFFHGEFTSKLPSRIMRTGFSDDFFFVAQWFPKFGVFETTGMRYAITDGWNCHQFHSTSEFYSNHSVYDVTLVVPENYVVGTGGKTLSEKPLGDGRKEIVTRAEDIVDYAWTAWPGYSVFRDKWKNVDITLLIPADRTNQAGRQMSAVKNALEYLDSRVGAYPWSHLTFVDPPAKGNGAGGMEYTTLFTSQSFRGVPWYIHMPEMVTVHEFGHAYFMGILASNEFEEPWLDEGVNSFWEIRIMDHYWKNGGMIEHPSFIMTDLTSARAGYVQAPGKQATTNAEYSWNYPHGTYGMMSYKKTALWLYTLMGIIGEDTMDEVFREYYRQWAFKYPSGRDFINVVNTTVTRMHGEKFGKDLNWFFDQTTFGTGICDYKVSGIRVNKVTGYEGISTRGIQYYLKKIQTGATVCTHLQLNSKELERLCCLSR